MINVPDSVKTAYKSDSTYKSYFVVFRDSGNVLTNTEIVSESLQITESICSSGSFKIGLCEASVCSFEAILPSNLYHDEMCVFHCLGEFDASWYTDNIYGLVLEGSGITNTYTGSTIDNLSHCILGDSSKSFKANKNYLFLAKVKYIYREIQLYFDNANGLRRTVYYINPYIFNEKEVDDWVNNKEYSYGEIVVCDDSAWKSISSSNTDRPSGLSSKWENISRYLQIAIPIPGSDSSNYSYAVYSKDTTLEIAAKLYEFDAFIMPLGLYGVDKCKKKNGGNQYSITGYSRAKDLKLSENVIISYDNSGTTIGDVVDEAVKNTQIALASNLSIEGTETKLESTTVENVPNWPSDPIYEGTRYITIQGTYNRHGSGYHHETSLEMWSLDDIYALGNVVYWKRDYFHIYGPLGNSRIRYVPYADGYYISDNVNFGSPYDPYLLLFCYYQTDGFPDTVSTSWFYPNKTGYLEAAPSDLAHHSLSARTVKKDDKVFGVKELYDYGYDWDLSSVVGWKLESETEVSEGNCYRVYSQKYTWNAKITAKTLQYKIENYLPSVEKIYEVSFNSPSIYGAYPSEQGIYEDAYRTLNGTFSTNKHNAIQTAITAFSTDGIISISNEGVFSISYIDSLFISLTTEGNTITTKTIVNDIYASPLVEVLIHSKEEKLNLFEITFNKTNDLQKQKREIITSYLEMNGLFIIFDRYGVSSLKSATLATLFPSENLFPRDASINPAYSNIYPSESGEILNTSLCKSLLVEDRMNDAFDGIKIIKSDTSASDASLYPFYYNRQTSEYGTVPGSISETGFFEGQNYYVIKDNFFFDNFIFTQSQLLEICRDLIKRIGFLRYFNINADIRALPYVETGDSILIMTPTSGIETLVLRRTMSGCIAMMDSIETDFYE